jgi:hypothetical protein
MDVSHFPPRPSPWPGRVARDLELLLLSILVGFCLWLIGGWMLAGQVAPTSPDAPIFSGDEETPELNAASSADSAGRPAGALAVAVADGVAMTAVGPIWTAFERRLTAPD